jgi:hypothetical protein
MPYWRSESGERAGLRTGVTGLAVPLAGGTAFWVSRAGFGLAAGAAVAGARTIGFAVVAARGWADAAAGLGPPADVAFVGVTDLAGGGPAAFADVIAGFGTAVAGGGAAARGAAVGAGSGAFPDVVAGFGLIAGATITGSAAPL